MPAGSRPNSNFVSARISPRSSARSAANRYRPSAAARAARYDVFAAEPLRLRLRDVEVVAFDRLGRGSHDRLGKPLGLDETGGQTVAADRARLPVLDPARAGEVAADDELDGQHLEASAFERAPVGPDREEVVPDDVARAREPERREAGEHPALVGDLRGQHDVEGRDAVGRDEEQLSLTERVDLADLAAGEVRRLRHGRRHVAARERAQPVEDGVDVDRVRAEVEDLVEVDASRDLAVGAHEHREVELLLPCAHCVPLHEPVRDVPRQAALDEGEQQPLAEEQPVARVDVRAHALRSARRARRRAMRSGRARSRARGTSRAARCAPRTSGRCRARARARRSRGRPVHSRARRAPSPQIRSATIGFRLCGIADDPFCPLPNGSSTSRTSVRARWRISTANRSSDDADQGDRREQLGMTVPLQDLGRARRRFEAQVIAGDALDLRVDRRVLADGARQLAHAEALERVLDPDAVALERECPSRRASARRSSARRGHRASGPCRASRDAPRPSRRRRGMSARARRSGAHPASWIATESAVSRTSDEVRPKWNQRPSSPSVSATASTNAATSWFVSRSSSATRAGVGGFASARMRSTASAGITPTAAQPSRAPRARRPASSRASPRPTRSESWRDGSSAGSLRQF